MIMVHELCMIGVGFGWSPEIDYRVFDLRIEYSRIYWQISIFLHKFPTVLVP